MQVAIVVGTRPEFIKTWSVINEINNRSNVDLLLIHTGQHYDYEMSQAFFEDLSITEPDYYLGVGSSDVTQQVTKVMLGVQKIINKEEIDILLVQGDTNSCMGAIISAAQLEVPTGHIEAGCRSFDRTMPEELNRIVIDSIANMLFAPSKTAYQNLLIEGANPENTFLVGNTALEALEKVLEKTNMNKEETSEPYVVATIHRARNADERNRLAEILKGLSELPIKCIFPMHPRTKKMVEKFGLRDYLNRGSLQTIAPLGYNNFISLLGNSKAVITDSGGVQEEAALLGKRTLTIRDNTEWPETVWEGMNTLVAAKASTIQEELECILEKKIAPPTDLYLCGAGKRIVDILVEFNANDKLSFSKLDMTRNGYPTLVLSKVPHRKVRMAFNEEGQFVTKDGYYFIVQDFQPLTEREYDLHNPED